MSPASKSKTKDKLAARAVKEQQKASSKPSSVPSNGGNGIPTSAYNPVSGTFHALETVPSASSPTPQNNGRFRTIDETEEHSGSSLGTAAEYDSVSNNDSCSGESEDQKEKTLTATMRIESVPGSDTDKRDKMRQKNERKHQRQRERRNQELHDRCHGYLMSRKLEALAQQIVGMGFSTERATMALILNEGRVEQSVTWIIEGGEETKQQTTANIDTAAKLKIDIADELAKIAYMEIKFKCTKQEVERAIIACEGDLEKAADSLKAQQNQEQEAVPPKLEESGFSPAVNGFNKLATSTQNPMVRIQAKAVASVSIQQPRKDERDFNHTKAVVTGTVSPDSANRNLQSLRRIQSKPDWARPQVTASVEKRWLSASSSPSVSLSVSPLQVAVPPAKTDSQYAIAGNEVKTNLHAGTLKEPVIVMQRPQSINAKQNLPSTSIGISATPPASSGWYPNGISSSELKVLNGVLGHNLPSLGVNGSSPQPFYPLNNYRPFVSSSLEPSAPGWGGSWSTRGTPTGTSSSLAVPSSLGLFTAGSSGSSSPVDWSKGGSMRQYDYTSIDWSLDSTPLIPSSARTNQLYDDWSPTYVKAARPVMNGGVCFAGLQDGGLGSDPIPSGGSREWTTPFHGQDLFRGPRQFVTYQSL